MRFVILWMRTLLLYIIEHSLGSWDELHNSPFFHQCAMAARRPCMAHVAQGIFARNCQLANAGSRLAGKSRSLRLQTGAAPSACPACLGLGCRAKLASRAFDSFFFLFFAARAREFQEHARLREWADYDTVNQNLKILFQNTCFVFHLNKKKALYQLCSKLQNC